METESIQIPNQITLTARKWLLFSLRHRLWPVKAWHYPCACAPSHTLHMCIAKRVGCAMKSLGQSRFGPSQTLVSESLHARCLIITALSNATWLAESFSRPAQLWLVPTYWPQSCAMQSWLIKCATCPLGLLAELLGWPHANVASHTCACLREVGFGLRVLDPIGFGHSSRASDPTS